MNVANDLAEAFVLALRAFSWPEWFNAEENIRGSDSDETFSGPTIVVAPDDSPEEQPFTGVADWQWPVRIEVVSPAHTLPAESEETSALQKHRELEVALESFVLADDLADQINTKAHAADPPLELTILSNPPVSPYANIENDTWISGWTVKCFVVRSRLSDW